MYRKFKANRLFTGSEMLGPEIMLVTDENGKVEAIVPTDGAGVEFVEGIICPGLVNAHCHLELSHLKGRIPKNTGLVSFVQEVMKMRNTNGSDIKQAMEDAEKEMLRGGIMAVGDICNTTDSASIKAESELYWRNFIELSGFVDATARKRLDEAKIVRRSFDNACIVPHSPYSVSAGLFKLIAEMNEAFVSIHNQESREENLLYENGSGDFLRLYKNLGIDISSFRATGKTSFSSWLPYFFQGQNLISVHNTFIDAADISMAQEGNSNIYFCLCPHANLYIENTLPPIDLLRKGGCKIVLGTDSYASNECLSIATEMSLLQERSPDIPLDEILTWATLNGAEALGFPGLGKFALGSKPGIVQLEIAENGQLTGTAARIL